MSEGWPKVWLIFATYRRTELALNTIRSLKEYLVYPNLHWHVADDGSGKTDDGTDRWHVGVLTEAIAEFYPDVTWHEMDTPPDQYNTGGNINRAIRAMQDAGCDIYMLNFDDWALAYGLDIRSAVDVLDHEPSVGFVRLSYHVPGHGLLTVSYDAPRMNTAYMWERIIREWSVSNPYGDRDHYLVSTQPYVAHMRFHDAYGWHPENISPGLAEIGLSNQYTHSPLGESGPQILWQIGPITVHAPWKHMKGHAHLYAEQFPQT